MTCSIHMLATMPVSSTKCLPLQAAGACNLHSSDPLMWNNSSWVRNTTALLN